MAHNSLSPGFVKLHYTFSSLTHTMTIPIIPTGTLTPGVVPNVMTYGGTPLGFAGALTALMTVMQPFFGGGTEFGNAEYWSQPTPEDDPLWIYTVGLGLPGTGVTAGAQMLQQTITYRTSNGGLYRQFFMEPTGSILPNSRNPYPFGAGAQTNMANYLMGATSWIYGRDGGKIIVPLFATGKFNDSLRKRRINL